MFERCGLLGVAAHFAVWIGTYLITLLLFASNESRSAYALLSGWWCALYAAAALATPAVASLTAGVVFLVLDLVAAAAGLPRLYHDSGVVDAGTIVDSFQRAVLFVSPILVNGVVAALKRWLAAARPAS